MYRCFVLAAALTIAAGLTAPAEAGPRCAELFTKMGRTFVPGAQIPPPDIKARETLLDCPADQYLQFSYDVSAVRDAVPVERVDQLVGTWASDEFLAVASGLFVPVYEILEIAAGEPPGEITIVQKLYRYADPATTWFRDDFKIPPVDVIAAGRISTYGEHRLILADPGSLEPRRARYFDFPIEGDRNTSLRMKLQFAPFIQTDPIKIGTNGERLVFEFFDRFAPGAKRTMTFRKREPATQRQALYVILLAEESSVHFHCFMQAIEGPSPALAAALGDTPVADFRSALEAAFSMAVDLEQLRLSLDEDRTKAEMKALGKKYLAKSEELRAFFADGPLAAIRATAEGRSGVSLGCPALN